MLPLMNALEFDAMTMHGEFVYGPAQPCRLTAWLTYLALAITVTTGCRTISSSIRVA